MIRLVSIISNMMGVARGAGIAKRSTSGSVIPSSWVQVAQSLVFCVSV